MASIVGYVAGGILVVAFCIAVVMSAARRGGWWD